jgi:hypothetical protein
MTSHVHGELSKAWQITYALFERLDDAVTSALRRQALSKKRRRAVYAKYPPEVRSVWISLLSDPIRRKHVQLDATWRLTQEGHSTLIELLIHFCVFTRTESGWRTLFDAACFADLLENLRTNPYHERINTTRSWAVSWSWLGSDNHDPGFICQSILCNNLSMEHPSELMQFAVEVLDHVLDKEIMSRMHLCVLQLVMSIAYSGGGAWMERLIRFARKHLLLSQSLSHRNSFTHLMLCHAPLSTLDEWMASPTGVDYALHSDWYHSVCFASDLNISSHPSTHEPRRAHLVTLQRRWNTEIFAMLHVHLPPDLVRFMVLPYLHGVA